MQGSTDYTSDELHSLCQSVKLLATALQSIARSPAAGHSWRTEPYASPLRSPMANTLRSPLPTTATTTTSIAPSPSYATQVLHESYEKAVQELHEYRTLLSAAQLELRRNEV